MTHKLYSLLTLKSGVKSDIPLRNPIKVTKLSVILSCSDPFWVSALLKIIPSFLLFSSLLEFVKKSESSVFVFGSFSFSINSLAVQNDTIWDGNRYKYILTIGIKIYRTAIGLMLGAP